MSYISNLDQYKIDALREYLEGNFEEFSKFCFKIMTGNELIYVDYYVVLFEAIQKLIDQTCTRLIINIPPRAGKTLFCSIFLPLFAWVRNPSGQTILTGFNSDVLAECSGYIRTIMSDPDFRRVFPDVIIDNNKKSVERLGTMNAGVLHAITTTGKMTGKGCGALVEGFAGLMSIDDIIKPDDAMSPTERDKINNRFSNTLLSRLNSVNTPLVIIMQRLHDNDLCGYLMRGGTSDVYEWLSIPGIITKETGSAEWYQKQIDEKGYTNVKPILYSLPESKHRKYVEYHFEGKAQKISSFWSVRKTIQTLMGLLSKDPYTFYSQYQGKPVGKGRAALSPDYISYYGEYDHRDIRYTFMTADTAATTQTYSDYSVSCYWGVSKHKELILLDIIIGKWEVPELLDQIRSFWKKHKKFDITKPTLCPRAMYMENKSSGLYLNQQFVRDGTVNVRPVPRDGTANNDKFTRFINTIPYFKSGRIIIPRDHVHTTHVVRELLGQSEYGSSTGNDDVADNFADAVTVAFAQQQMSYESWS